MTQLYIMPVFGGKDAGQRPGSVPVPGAVGTQRQPRSDHRPIHNTAGPSGNTDPAVMNR